MRPRYSTPRSSAGVCCALAAASRVCTVLSSFATVGRRATSSGGASPARSSSDESSSSVEKPCRCVSSSEDDSPGWKSPSSTSDSSSPAGGSGCLEMEARLEDEGPAFDGVAVLSFGAGLPFASFALPLTAGDGVSAVVDLGLLVSFGLLLSASGFSGDDDGAALAFADFSLLVSTASASLDFGVCLAGFSAPAAGASFVFAFLLAGSSTGALTGVASDLRLLPSFAGTCRMTSHHRQTHQDQDVPPLPSPRRVSASSQASAPHRRPSAEPRVSTRAAHKVAMVHTSSPALRDFFDFFFFNVGSGSSTTMGASASDLRAFFALFGGSSVAGCCPTVCSMRGTEDAEALTYLDVRFPRLLTVRSRLLLLRGCRG